MVVEYFTKRVKVASYANLIMSTVIKSHSQCPKKISYQQRMPEKIIHHISAVKAAKKQNNNKTRIIGKMIEIGKDWHIEVTTFIEAAPFSLVHEVGVILPIEAEIPFL
ncbi:RNA-directed DNA polymerase [Gossypium australe]|uniref:RNA-directed DNA polymerase n=1 Tax=Gossypium australe TaxID=47621 RepID=A0A5B6VJW5_9ROSI|nr:RNA-directed DNA polymerase [Gossypium australe]